MRRGIRTLSPYPSLSAPQSCTEFEVSSFGSFEDTLKVTKTYQFALLCNGDKVTHPYSTNHFSR